MKVTVFQNGKPVEIEVRANGNTEATILLNELVAGGYISGYLMLLKKEDDK